MHIKQEKSCFFYVKVINWLEKIKNRYKILPIPCIQNINGI